jgi:uncharacterized protein (DUF58 family)
VTQSSVLRPPSSHTFPRWTPGFQQALEQLAIATRRPARSHHPGAVRSRWRGRALEFADYRPYSPGDEPRLVDWRAYSRLGRLYLKQYEEERARRLTVLLDTSASLDWGEGDAHKGDYARRLVASLAWISLNHHDAVQVFLLRDGAAHPLPPLTHRAATMALFQQLGTLQERGRTELAAATRAVPLLQATGPVLLLSDLLDPSWPEALGALGAAGEGAVLQLLAPQEWEPPLGEEVELEDVETGERRATRLGPLEVADYRRRLQSFLTSVRERCARLGLLHLALNTATPLQETVLRHLPAAGLLHG